MPYCVLPKEYIHVLSLQSGWWLLCVCACECEFVHVFFFFFIIILLFLEWVMILIYAVYSTFPLLSQWLRNIFLLTLRDFWIIPHESWVNDSPVGVFLKGCAECFKTESIPPTCKSKEMLWCGWMWNLSDALVAYATLWNIPLCERVGNV